MSVHGGLWPAQSLYQVGTVVFHVSSHPFKYASCLSTHISPSNVGFKIVEFHCTVCGIFTPRYGSTSYVRTKIAGSSGVLNREPTGCTSSSTCSLVSEEWEKNPFCKLFLLVVPYVVKWVFCVYLIKTLLKRWWRCWNWSVDFTHSLLSNYSKRKFSANPSIGINTSYTLPHYEEH